MVWNGNIRAPFLWFILHNVCSHILFVPHFAQGAGEVMGEVSEDDEAYPIEKSRQRRRSKDVGEEITGNSFGRGKKILLFLFFNSPLAQLYFTFLSHSTSFPNFFMSYSLLGHDDERGLARRHKADGGGARADESLCLGRTCICRLQHGSLCGKYGWRRGRNEGERRGDISKNSLFFCLSLFQ